MLDAEIKNKEYSDWVRFERKVKSIDSEMEVSDKRALRIGNDFLTYRGMRIYLEESGGVSQDDCACLVELLTTTLPHWFIRQEF